MAATNNNTASIGFEQQIWSPADSELFEEKMTRLTAELSDMFKRFHELEEEIKNGLGAIGYEF